MGQSGGDGENVVEEVWLELVEKEISSALWEKSASRIEGKISAMLCFFKMAPLKRRQEAELESSSLWEYSTYDVVREDI